MARLRTIKPGFFTNDDLGECQPLTRLLFAGLWCHADRAGRLEDRPKRLKVEVLPYDDCDIEALLGELVAHGFIHRYEAMGQRYIAIPTWCKHQNPHIKETESIIPAPSLPGQNDARLSSIEDKNQESTVQAPDEHSSSRAGLVIGDLELVIGEKTGALVADATAPPSGSKSGQLIDLLRAADVPHALTAEDHKKLKASPLTPGQVAEVYIAIAHKDWGTEFHWTGLSVANAIKWWPPYQANKTTPDKPKATNGRYSRAADLSQHATDTARRIDDARQHAATGRELSALHPELRGLPS